MANDTISGRLRSNRGNAYELELCQAFNNWNSHDHDVLPNLFNYLLASHQVQSSEIEKMESHNNIPKLKSGGSPKADIELKVFLRNKKELLFNISCKRTNARSVTYHEYPAREYVRVLGITEIKLIELIEKHQADGSAINFSLIERKYFKETIQKYKMKLWEWVILGKHAKDDNPHIVNLIIANDKLYIFSDFVDYLNKKTSGLGTGLNWTYQSSGKGRTIQLKGPVLR